MKKLAIIGMVFAGLMLSTSTAWSKPTGMTQAEYRALLVRSDGLNQKYGLGQYSQQAINSKLGEIGAWAVPSTPKTDSTPLVSEKLAGLDVGTPTTTLASSGEGFDWNDAAIGAALAFGFVVLGVGSLLTVRQQHKPIPH
jgi:hypothetical protein